MVAVMYGADDRMFAPAPVAVVTASAAALPNSLVPVDTTAGAVTVTLPSAPTDRTVVAVIMVKQGGSNAVTVACSGTDVFQVAGGATTATISSVLTGAMWQYSAAAGIWYELSAPGTSAVSSVFGRTGAVAAQSGDYAFSQISGTASAAQTPLMLPLAGGTMSGQITAQANYAAQPSAAGNTVLSINVGASDSFDRMRLLANSIAMGPGNAARDAQIARTGTGLWVVSNPATAHDATMAVDGNVVVGGTAGLGDNGVGEVAYANAPTVPSTNPAGGVVTYASAGLLYARDPSGNVYQLTRPAAVATGPTTITGANTKQLLAAGVTVPANSLGAGQVFTFRAWGTLSTNAASDTFTFALMWGGVSGTQIFTWGAQQPNGSSTVSGVSWLTQFEIVAESATSVTVCGWNGLDYYFTSETQAGTTVSNTSAEQLVLAVTPLSTSDSITCAGFYCVRVV